ncbi:12864_t:CDS:2 [Funneliformis mosseae]|uniref:12864_t:CDS:1 n=1 Tax=Funneliformis mosseae TaxID=27381 RepID=A0A9N9CFZ4_FUNMO|nr:12864_t:CDS:2 [Funneliformis mosseae]
MRCYKINAGFQFKAEVEEILDINQRPRKVNKSETEHDFSLLDERISYTAEDSLYFDEERTEAEHDFGLLKERSAYISEAQQEFSILTDLYLTKPNEITLK